MSGVGGVKVHGAAEVLSRVMPEWSARLLADLGLYFVLVGAGYMLLSRVRAHPPGEGDQRLVARVARFMFIGYPAPTEQYVAVSSDEENARTGGAATAAKAAQAAQAAKLVEGESKAEWSTLYKALNLSWCTLGLLGSYLLWGVLQEKIVTTEYAAGRFQSTIFLVVCNRALALLVALVMIRVTQQPPLRAPFYQYALTSLSNVLSSWCQLEALKYISFPTQVLAKSSKMVPVMVMGRLVRGKRYDYSEYLVALLIGLGVTIFTLNSDEGSGKEDQTTTLGGVLLIVGYLAFDSFTSQWQGHLFKEYKMSSYQMMVGVNVWSLLFAGSSLLANGEAITSVAFLLNDPVALRDNLLFSIAGASGQMFIFYTIKTWGPLVFTIIMTTRQLLSVVFSMLLFGHLINAESAVGALVCFGAVAYKVYKDSTESANKKHAEKKMSNHLSSAAERDEQNELAPIKR